MKVFSRVPAAARPAGKPARAAVHRPVPEARQARRAARLVAYLAAPAGKPVAGRRRRHQDKPEVDKRAVRIQRVGQQAGRPARQAAALTLVAVRQQAEVPRKQAVK